MINIEYKKYLKNIPLLIIMQTENGEEIILLDEHEEKIQQFLSKFMDDIHRLADHYRRGIFKDTYQPFGNQLLLESKNFLNTHDVPLEARIQIICWHFWLSGFLDGQKLEICPENIISSIKM